MNLLTTQDGFPFHSAQRDMAEALPQIVWTARPDATVDWINSEFRRYSGLEDHSSPAGSWLLAVHPDDRAPILKIWTQTVARGKPYRTEFRIWCAAEQRWRAHLVDARPHHDTMGQVQRWFGIATDIQDLRDADAAREIELRIRGVESQVMEQVSAGDTLDVILDDVCRAMGYVLDGARASVALLNDDRTRLDRWHAPELPDDWLNHVIGLPAAEGAVACGTAAHRGTFVAVTDIATDPLFRDLRRAAIAHGLRACWSVPVHDSQGRVMACFAAYFDRPRTPTEVQINLLRRMVRFIRVAIEHVGARDRLHASEQRYRSLFDLTPIAIWEEDISGIQRMLDDLRATGVTDFAAWLGNNPDFLDKVIASVRVLDANCAAMELHGIAEERALASHLAVLGRDPQSRASITGMIVALFDRKSDYQTKQSIVRSDGSRAEVQLRMLLPDYDGGRLLVTALDVTEQQRAEERFRHVAQASSDYIFDRDFASETTWVNDAASWHPGYPAGPCEVPRSAWVDSVHPEDSEEITRQIEDAVSGGVNFWEGEYRLRLHNGSYIPVRERASIIRNKAGLPVRMIGNIVDLSEQKALEAQLRQSQRLDAVGQLTGGIAHDFNNLLTVILGNAEMLRDSLPANGHAVTMAGHVLAASERAADLTQRLLAFARKQPLSPGYHDPNALIEGMRLLVERSITPAVTLELDLDEGVGPVHLDHAMFESALLNLCVNARDAMPDGGTLRIQTRTIAVPGSDEIDAPPPGNYVRVTVSDTGTGMDAQTMARAFEPFFTTKATGAGSGLGLSMVYGFVRQSEGHIRIRSVSGEGSNIEILLPSAASDAEVPASEPDEANLEAAAASARILIVEDDELVREYTTMIVESLGYQTKAVSQAAPALDLLKAGERFDLLLSDIVMPGGMSGRQLAEAALNLKPSLPILLVSGHSEEMAASDVRADPRIGFLRKPFRKRELARRLAELLGN